MTTRLISRRHLLATLGAGLATPAFGLDTSTVLPPRLRDPVGKGALESVEPLIKKANLGGKVTYAVADAHTGQLLETRSHLTAMPPASVTKAITALYALEHLGSGFRYRTRLLANGTVTNGQLDGDLVLEASGDPVFSTEDLGRMVNALQTAGIKRVKGRFLVYLPPFAEAPLIDKSQPYQVSYNPGIAGLNLNFNRVHFEWKKSGTGHDFTMEARTANYRPASRTSTMEIVDRPGPVYEFRREAGIDRWSVARGALGSKGARWLPVRAPVDYALDALDRLLDAKGIIVPSAQRSRVRPSGITVFEAVSPPMSDILRGMLKVSTNLTAEVVGQTATIASGHEPSSIRDSAASMSKWLGAMSRARRPRFVDHSGLGVGNDITAHDMVSALAYAGSDGDLAKLLKPWYFRTPQGGADRANKVKVVAKTGTLNFVSGLAGFITPPGGRSLVFAIFSADEPRRKGLRREERERPTGGKRWSRRARRLDDELLKRWTRLYT